MRVSTIFADVLEKNPDESKDVIRKRFKTNDELRSFKSCDNYGENVTEDKLQEPEEIFKKRLIIVYKTEGDSPDVNATPCEVSDVIEDAPVEVGLVMMDDAQTMKETDTPIPKKSILYVLLFIVWSICTVALGIFFAEVVYPKLK